MAHQTCRVLRTRLIEGKSRMTAFRKWKGRELKQPIVEFGERVMYYKPGVKGTEDGKPVEHGNLARNER